MITATKARAIVDNRTTDPPTSPDRPSNQMPATLIEQLFSRISEVSSFPEAAQQIIELAEAPDTGADDLLEAVRQDPALAMRLMRTVNSSCFGLQNEISDLKQAITLLGFDELRNLALTSYVARLFRESPGHGVYVRRGLWRHLVATAMVARVPAETCGKVKPQEAYLAGAVHDLGLILIDQYIHRAFCRVVDGQSEAEPLCDVETRVLGFDHTALGRYVAQKWNLPQSAIAAIAHHHTPLLYDGPHRHMVYIVSVANFLCHCKGVTSLGVSQTHAPPVQVFTELGLGREDISEICARLDDILGAAADMATVQAR